MCTVFLPELKQFGLPKMVIIRHILQAKVGSHQFNTRWAKGGRFNCQTRSVLSKSLHTHCVPCYFVHRAVRLVCIHTSWYWKHSYHVIASPLLWLYPKWFKKWVSHEHTWTLSAGSVKRDFCVPLPLCLGRLHLSGLLYLLHLRPTLEVISQKKLHPMWNRLNNTAIIIILVT